MSGCYDSTRRKTPVVNMSGCYVRQNPAVERRNEGMGENREDKDGRTKEKWILEPL